MSKIKNVTIVVLIITSFVQLSYIWNVSVSNLFAPTYEIVVSDEYLKDILAPNKAYIKEGDNFKVAYYTKENSVTNRGVISLLSEIVNKGEYIPVTKATNEMLSNAEAVYCYPAVIDEELLHSVLDSKNYNFNDIGLSFNYIYIDEDGKEANLFNSETGENFTFSMANMEKINIPKEYVFNENIEFEYNESNYLNNNLFFTPVVVEGDYFNIKGTNPYSENDEILVSTVESKINRFFKAPNEKWTIYDDDSYIFSGEDITVKYYGNNVLEYRNNNDSSKKVDVATALAIAKSYIDLDEYVTNDLILKKIESSENSYMFYFNPIVNNTEVVFDSEAIDYYIQIEVTNGIVKQYKKYVYNYSKDFNVTDILDTNASIFSLGEHFNNVELVYLQNIEELNAPLYWAMTFNDDTVYTKAQTD